MAHFRSAFILIVIPDNVSLLVGAESAPYELRHTDVGPTLNPALGLITESVDDPDSGRYGIAD